MAKRRARSDGGGETGDGGDGGTIVEAVLFTLAFPEEAVAVRADHDGTTTTVSLYDGLLSRAVESLPADAFVRVPDQRRNALLEKVAAVANQIDTDAYQAAGRKLRTDVARSVEQWLVEDYEAAPNQYTMAELLELIDDLVSRLDGLAGSQGK